MANESENKPSSGQKSGKRKRKRHGWSSLSYATRLTISFAAIAAMTAMVAIGVLSFVWEQHFRTYTEDNMASIAKNIAAQISENYEKSNVLGGNTLDPAKAVTTARPDVGVQVIDKDRMAIVYDSSRAVQGETGSPISLAPPVGDKTQVSDIVVKDEDGKENVVGYVRVWVYGSDQLLRTTDEIFRDNSYQAMIFATGLAIVLASCIGFLFARNLVNPINRISKTAQAIAEGDLSARTNFKGDDEIARLGETFDAMADSVEKDREIERRLTTDVAHELRTPLMAIQSTVEAMVDGIFEPDVERLETLNSEVQRLSRLVNSLLKLSRLESRNTPMNEEVVNVGELIAGIVATHEAFVIDSGLSMEFHADKDVFVYGDADMIRQATANLISNAVRYTPEGGHIAVRVKRGDIMASIAVQDTGIGLTPEEAKMVFSRFWRADAGRNREQGGLGVGLAVVKEIVDRHGGWVHVEGKPNEGATFTIYIPLFDEDRVKSRLRNKEKNKRQARK